MSTTIRVVCLRVFWAEDGKLWCDFSLWFSSGVSNGLVGKGLPLTKAFKHGSKTFSGG